MRALAREGIVAGETGAAGLAGLIELLTGAENAQHREALGIDERSRALLFVTEGATDPAAYRQIVGEERAQPCCHPEPAQRGEGPRSCKNRFLAIRRPLAALLVTASARSEPLQRQPNEIFRAPRFLAALLNIAHRLVRLDLLVAERDQAPGQLRWPAPARVSAPARRSPLPRPPPRPSLSFNSRTIRSAVFFPSPLIFESDATSEFTTAVLK